jgi:acyl-coenzyme A synthetase/AMP-(fatty) acid ligase
MQRRVAGLTVAVKASGFRNLLFRSDRPADLLVALGAAEGLSIPLVVAHTYLPEEQVRAIAAQQGLEATVLENDTIEPLGPWRETSPLSQPGIYLMTAGTTGIPKIACHQIPSLVGRIRTGSTSPLAGQRWLLTYGTTTFAGVQVLLTALLTRGTLVAATTQRVPELAAAARKHAIHNISGTPTFWRALLLTLDAGSTLDSLRQITMGGELADQATLDRLRARFPNARITHIYATTEAGAVFAVNDGRAGFPAAWLTQPVDGVALAIIDGILHIRSQRRMNGYVSGHPSPITSEGWVCTGDLVRVEAERVYFLGRNDRTINIGGAKVTPEEVEAFLVAVDGVAEARVSGVPNPITGQVLVAEIVCSPGSDPNEVRETVSRKCRAMLPSHKVPRVVRVVDSIDIAASGKKSTTGRSPSGT